MFGFIDFTGSRFVAIFLTLSLVLEVETAIAAKNVNHKPLAPICILKSEKLWIRMVIIPVRFPI